MQKVNQQEIIDLGQPHYTLAEYHKCLDQLAQIGFYLGGNRSILQAINGLGSAPKSIVDFGCGTGRSIDVIGRDSTVHWIGIDLSLEMLRQARGRIEALPQRRNFLTVRANLTELGAIDSSRADIGLCLFSTLGMISDRANRKKFLQEVRRILKPGGTFILHAHNLWYALRFPRGLRWLTTNLCGAILGRGEFGDRTADFQDTRQLQLRHFRYSELKRTLRETGFQLQTVYRLADELQRGYRPWHALATPGWLLVCRSV